MIIGRAAAPRCYEAAGDIAAIGVAVAYGVEAEPEFGGDAGRGGEQRDSAGDHL